MTYQLGLSDELIKRGVNQAFHVSLLRPHVPNDDRRFPGRLPIQIPGFGEKPKEWIVERIVTHHGKGMGSEFQILWKAGDTTWAPYKEVVHLNALDCYCELMGVKDASELLSNYVNENSDNEENDIIKVHTCIVRRDKRDGLAMVDLSIRSSSHSSPLLTDLIMQSNLNVHEVHKCLDYEHSLNSHRLGVGSPPMIPPPNRWNNYLIEQDALRGQRQNPMANQNFHQRLPLMLPSFADNVSMPANMLETIIQAVGITTCAPAPPPIRTQVVNHYIPHRPVPPPPNHNRGRGGNAGRGHGHDPPNRRGKRGGHPEEPRRNQRIDQVQDLAPTITTAVTEPINNTAAGPSSNLDGLNFLEEFANTDLSVISGDNVTMGSESSTGDFTI